jgi:hypothetical protein
VLLWFLEDERKMGWYMAQEATTLKYREIGPRLTGPASTSRDLRCGDAKYYVRQERDIGKHWETNWKSKEQKVHSHSCTCTHGMHLAAKNLFHK